MNSKTYKESKAPQRVRLNDEIVHRHQQRVYNQRVPDLAKRTGLPYMLVYNIVHRRVNSISHRYFRRLFGEDPPAQTPQRVDGTLFRNMARLWLFLNSHESIADLNKALTRDEPTKKPDYRVFSGQVKSVDAALEQAMVQKFQKTGLEMDAVRQWITEMEQMQHVQRIPYHRVRPSLLFLKEKLDIHPNAILNQLFDRYERGELKSVPHQVYEKAEALRKKAQSALNTGTRLEIERIREEVYGPKSGYTLYADVAQELKFLQRYARKSPKRYLGRSISVYDKGIIKHVASLKAAAVRRDCHTFIRQHPELPLNVLPPNDRRRQAAPLLGLLINRATDLMLQDKGLELEKQILAPASSREAYKKQEFGFTRFDLASRSLGMRQKAFDLMVARNCNIFREVGHYDRHWYLSDLYLKELSQKPNFTLINAKYELLSRKLKPEESENTCMN